MSLRIDQLSHAYPRGEAVLKALDLEFAPGITGVLGSNGAGKSTLIRILATLMRPSKGRVWWRDVDALAQPGKLRRVLGYLPQDFAVFPQLTALEFLQYVGALKGLKSASVRRQGLELLELLHLEPHRLLSTCSGGMRQRVGIAQALLGRPELLILDEPTVGLDVEERLNFRRMLSELPGRPTILLSTHIVSDLEGGVDRLMLLAVGKVQFHDTPERLLETVQGQVWTWTEAVGEPSALERSSEPGLYLRSKRGEQLEVRCIHPIRPHPQAQPTAATLEDAFRVFTHRHTTHEVSHA